LKLGGTVSEEQTSWVWFLEKKDKHMSEKLICFELVQEYAIGVKKRLETSPLMEEEILIGREELKDLPISVLRGILSGLSFALMTVNKMGFEESDQTAREIITGLSMLVASYSVELTERVQKNGLNEDDWD
jgi:hypothetical protein